MKYRILLSDADGTLFDFHKGEGIAIRNTFEAFDVPYTDENVAAYVKANAEQWKLLELGQTTQPKLRVDRFVNFLKAIGHPADPQAMADAFVVQLGMQCWPLEQAEELCRRVSGQMPIYLVTNGIAQVQRSRFGDCDLAKYFAGLVISEEVGASKPDPKMLFEALRMAGDIRPEEAVLLGDSVTADIAAANNAGIDSILFTNGKDAPENHGATWAVKTLEEAWELILQR
ncbi:MAG: YjjG family noncanonical pyrimidine nucleotidase [Clostridia bacterium]|nr:YjjG family noncanonical pyrimidine nucleotidase [Clostridia bacterium]